MEMFTGIAIGAVVGAIVIGVIVKTVAAQQTKQKQQELEKAKKEILGKTERIKRLDVDKKQQDDKLTDLQKENEDYEEKLKESEEENTKLFDEIDESKAEIEQYKKQLTAANEGAREKGQELEQFKEKVDEQEINIGSLNEKVAAKDKEIENTKKQLSEQLETAKDEFTKKEQLLKTENENLNDKLKELEGQQQQNERLCAKTIQQLRRALSSLESLPIAEDIPDYDGEEDEEDSPELTIQLAEQENLLKTREADLIKYKNQIKRMTEALEASVDNDKIMQEQAKQIGKYEQQLIDKQKEINDKGDMIEQYIERIDQFEKDGVSTSAETSSEDVDTKAAINNDSNLLGAQKNSLIMLYSQFTNKGEKEETESEENKE